ncbi:phosphatase PAP2 family protein [Mucilaginibacter sp.]|uniref:phosphatase PAP2 family protein n=1 Tax=Mucilaginibacter sp. TaxID=1882438 RepID=UPI0035BC04D0
MNIGAKDVLYRVRYLLIPYMFILCACLIIKIIYTRSEIYFAVNAIYSSWADAAAPYITDIGDGNTILLVSALMLLYSYRAGFLLVTSYAITSVTAQILKYTFDAPRPKVYFEKDLGKIHFVKDLYILTVHSFPSGHTVTAFSAAVVITYLIKNKQWGIVLLAVALLVGYSRMYLSQHFFEDVLAGSVVGVMVTILWLSWLDRREFINSPRWCRGLLKK